VVWRIYYKALIVLATAPAVVVILVCNYNDMTSCFDHRAVMVAFELSTVRSTHYSYAAITVYFRYLLHTATASRAEIVCYITSRQATGSHSYAQHVKLCTQSCVSRGSGVHLLLGSEMCHCEQRSQQLCTLLYACALLLQPSAAQH
jgi:hypothetical protein